MRIKLFLLFLTFVCVASAQTGNSQQVRLQKWAQPVTEVSLKNMYKLDEGVYRCEQPDEKDFAELEKFGIKEVLNLRGWHSDDKEAKSTGLILHRIKMAAHNISSKDIVSALRFIKNRKGDIIIHCQHGSDRTGIVCAMYRIIFQGWSREEAIQELKKGGYGFHRIYFNIPYYIKNVNIEKIRAQVNK